MKNESEYVKGKEVVAFNQSNYPVMVEVFEVNDDYVKFASNLSKKVITSSVKYGTEDRPYFMHHGEKYYLDECMRVGF
jgi:hypothetical protein